MEKKDLRIVYMGTPEFAVESLKRLVEGGYNVVAVITMPDKPMGRHGSVLQASPVKQYAVSQGLKVLQPERLKDEAFVEELRALKADLQIVVAFRMLPEVVWDMPPMGTFNLHAKTGKAVRDYRKLPHGRVSLSTENLRLNLSINLDEHGIHPAQVLIDESKMASQYANNMYIKNLLKTY